MARKYPHLSYNVSAYVDDTGDALTLHRGLETFKEAVEAAENFAQPIDPPTLVFIDSFITQIEDFIDEDGTLYAIPTDVITELYIEFFEGAWIVECDKEGESDWLTQNGRHVI